MFARDIFDGFFGNDNAPNAANPYFEQIKAILDQYYKPYIEAGSRAIPKLEEQYGNLIDNPVGFINDMGKGYQKSPGYDFALQQALQGGTHAANAGGMGGSPQHQQWAMQTATGLANQDYGNWLSRALGAYQTGLTGEQGLFNGGIDTTNAFTEGMGNALSTQGTMNYMNEQNKNQFFQQMLAAALGAGMKGVMGGML